MNIELQTDTPKVQWIEITEDNSEQRLDNFLISRLKGVPKSFIYRIVRKGEVRVNKGRVDIKHRLAVGDIVRIPPVRQQAGAEEPLPVNKSIADTLRKSILFEDDAILVMNKPAGLAVHGGSGVDSAVIEGLRAMNPDQRFLELAHRLDRDTSGCLLIAKKRSALRALHEQFRDDRVAKTYLALLSGQWANKESRINQPLLKNISKGGERIVVISRQGKESETLFRRLKLYSEATLVQVTPKTGRTHQIRVHAAFMNHPIIGDERYGYDQANKYFKAKGYKRMFLHAEILAFDHPVTGKKIKFSAPLPQHFNNFIGNEQEV